MIQIEVHKGFLLAYTLLTAAGCESVQMSEQPESISPTSVELYALSTHEKVSYSVFEHSDENVRVKGVQSLEQSVSHFFEHQAAYIVVEPNGIKYELSSNEYAVSVVCPIGYEYLVYAPQGVRTEELTALSMQKLQKRTLVLGESAFQDHSAFNNSLNLVSQERAAQITQITLAQFEASVLQQTDSAAFLLCTP
jgi:hypothetical protein